MKLGRFPRLSRIHRGAALALGLAVIPEAAAHEFWIEPEAFLVEAGAPIRADLKVGQDFSGNRLGYNSRRFRRFDLVTPEGLEPITSRLGDVPAVDQASDVAGHHVIVHVTVDTVLTYEALERFADFADKDGLDGALDAHAARGLPDAGFREAYSRAAKSLVRVGSAGEGPVDRVFGLPTELVLKGNPYLDASVAVTAYLGGSPVPNVQIAVFERGADGEVKRSDLRTGDTGSIALTLERGTTYLLSAVSLRQPSAQLAEELDVVWESLWASLTFAVPN